MYQKLLELLSKKHECYAKSTSKFWDDEHISKGMLEAHLNPHWDAASRNHDFMKASVEWITKLAPPTIYKKLLDLGCGPGLYAEEFYKKGYEVTGIDFSTRSIEYGQNQANEKSLNITYQYMNYLDISFNEEFDVITLIYCDFGVLSDSNRKQLLDKIYKALKANGKLIFDVYTPLQYKDVAETKDWTYHEKGFWSNEPHVCLNAHYIYKENNTHLNQTHVITKDKVECYNIWEHTFTIEELQDDLKKAGFGSIAFYSDVAGNEYSSDSKVICTVATKGS